MKPITVMTQGGFIRSGALDSDALCRLKEFFERRQMGTLVSELLEGDLKDYEAVVLGAAINQYVTEVPEDAVVLGELATFLGQFAGEASLHSEGVTVK